MMINLMSIRPQGTKILLKHKRLQNLLYKDLEKMVTNTLLYKN